MSKDRMEINGYPISIDAVGRIYIPSALRIANHIVPQQKYELFCNDKGLFFFKVD